MAQQVEVASVIAATPREVPSRVRMVALVAIALGVIGVGAGFAMYGADRLRASFIFNFMYFAGISEGAFMFAAVCTLTDTRWGRGFKRIAEGYALFFPVMALLWVVFVVTGGLDIYPWMHEEMPAHKAVYLTSGGYIARVGGALALISVLNLLYVRTSLRLDIGTIQAQVGDRAPGFWKTIAAGWRGDSEVESLMARMNVLAVFCVLAFAFGWGMVSVDVSMSLAPHWFANMFPAWYTASCFWSGLVFIGIYSQLSRGWLGIDHVIKPSSYHDLGKLTFAFTMFWGYTLFAQYLAIWYGNMTEEIGFILLRTQVQPWADLSKVVVCLCFFVPFAMLLSRGLKKIPAAYLAVTTVIAVGVWLERFLVSVPSVSHADTLPLGIPEVAMGIGLLGAMWLVLTTFMSKVPPVPVADPFLQPHPEDVHVHPSAEFAGGSGNH